jgi:4-hydroxy-4-methyl-2-oxoglutarate aldolase
MADTASRLLQLGVATLHEAIGRGAVSRNLRLLVGPPFAGTAVTVGLAAGDNLGVHLAIEAARAGDVVCVASAGAGTYGVLGDLLLETARAKGLAGLVIDDGIRDVSTLAPPPSVSSRGLSAHGTVKRRVRQPVGAAVGIDNLFVRSGDWIVCDGDGLCVVRARDLARTLGAASAREEKEADLAEAFAEGASSSSLLGLPDATSRVSLS